MEELDIALACGAAVVGVNNRNLHTFQLDLGTTERVARRCATLNGGGAGAALGPPTVLALSGISGPADVNR